MRGRLAARMADHLLPLVAGASRPQYSMSLMDAEALLDTRDGSCAFPELRAQTERAIAWARAHCAGPFPGTLVESKPVARRDEVFPVAVLNDTITQFPTFSEAFGYALRDLPDQDLLVPADFCAHRMMTPTR